MSPFLKQVANYLYKYHNDNLSDYCIVFPGKRAGIFFTAYLNEIAEKPMLSPEITSINELFSKLSGLQQADQLTLILKLHDVYRKITGHQETIDEFYFWGDILLDDFGDLDKYLVDANALFRNIADLKELEGQFDYLNEEQKQAIEEFWGNMQKVSGSLNKDSFISVWSRLAEIYQLFRKELKDNNLAFGGMIYREVIENLDQNPRMLSATKYVFVGFNALDNCEQALFRYLDKQKRAMFFWDYANFYIDAKENEAGRFIRLNSVQFPAPNGFVPDSPAIERTIKVVSVPGNLVQAQAINLTQVTENFQTSNRFDNTALVLADENLLVPVISAVGGKTEGINITMGYPFVNTPIYGFISQLITLQKNVRNIADSAVFYYKQVVAILNHQFIINDNTKQFVSDINRRNKVYIKALELHFSPFAAKIFSQPANSTELLNYFSEIIKELAQQIASDEEGKHLLDSEYLFQAHLIIKQLQNSINKQTLSEYPIKTILRLLDQGLRRITVPFEGEPLAGLQVMGVLETRCLDFENVVLFSVNEGALPRVAVNHSFVPYHLRKGFGMPTFEDHDAMHAYYFYRLLQRNKHTVMVYNSITEGVWSVEKSRFLYQLQYDSGFKLEHLNLSLSFSGTTQEPIAIPSGEKYINKLASVYAEKELSPSAINTWLDCKLKFYFRYLAQIGEKEEIKEEIDSALFGTLFHYTIEQIYRPYVGKTIESQELKTLAADKHKINETVRQAIARIYYGMNDNEKSTFEPKGQDLLIFLHLVEYIASLIEGDCKFAPFTIIALERRYSETYQVLSGNKLINIKVGGIIDRIDQTDKGLRIIDYKTGQSLKTSFSKWEELTNSELSERRKEIFQTLVYSDILSRTETQPILPTIYKLSNFRDEDIDHSIIYDKEKLVYQNVQNEFRESFSCVLTEMFNPENIFTQAVDPKKCGYCPYNALCFRM